MAIIPYAQAKAASASGTSHDFTFTGVAEDLQLSQIQLDFSATPGASSWFLTYDSDRLLRVAGSAVTATQAGAAGFGIATALNGVVVAAGVLGTAGTLYLRVITTNAVTVTPRLVGYRG